MHRGRGEREKIPQGGKRRGFHSLEGLRTPQGGKGRGFQRERISQTGKGRGFHGEGEGEDSITQQRSNAAAL